MGVIPQPLRVEPQLGVLRLPRDFSIGCFGDGATDIGRLFAETMKSRYRAAYTVESLMASTSGDQAFAVSLRVEASVPSISEFDLKEEGYDLTITEGEGIVILALRPNGLFYGVQTLLQLFPSVGVSGDEKEAEFELDAVKIIDAPRFRWRGTMLDVGRHFFSIAFIKKFLDLLAMHKINKFHWHLTEDQGWRLEIKSLPRLTEVGAWRTQDDDESYGGFYRQEEIPDILAYAAARYIEVVPEIELPGHCGAALASYPHLSCRGDIVETPADWGIHDDVYCAGKDDVFDFLEQVLGEVTELFPAEYIHIGGDECPKVRWKNCPKCQERIKAEGLNGENELQTWFIQRISNFLKKRGRKIIGWDEILEGGLPEGATVMSWRGFLGGTMSAKLGHNVIMTPTQHCYLDYRQSSSHDEPGAWYAVLPLETVYTFDPIPSPWASFQGNTANDEGNKSSNREQTYRKGDDDCEAESFKGENTKDEGGAHRSEVRSTDDAEQLGVDAKYSDEAKKARDQNGCDIPPLTPEEQKLVSGGQANLWTEYVADEETAEYMLLPRLCAFSECVWSSTESKDWHRFHDCLQSHLRYFDAMGVKYRPLQ